MHQPSNTVKKVISQLLSRDEAGQRKYNTTMDRTDLVDTDWLQHMLEEMLDGAQYASRAIEVIEQKNRAWIKLLNTIQLTIEAVESGTYTGANPLEDIKQALFQYNVDRLPQSG